MYSYQSVVDQLHNVGFKPGRIFRGEIEALTQLLLDDEVIEHYMTGRYQAGPALIVATNRRLLLVDKKPFNLTVEDIPFDMISEVEYTMQAFNAFITVHSISKTIEVMSFRQNLLREFAGYVQHKVMHIRAMRQNQSAVNPNPVQDLIDAQANRNRIASPTQAQTGGQLYSKFKPFYKQSSTMPVNLNNPAAHSSPPATTYYSNYR